METKAATLEAGAKVNHLSYVGDAHVGANANLGAGTITCNYDGFSKHKTLIGEKDVPDDAMAVERSQQTNREGGAKRYRELKTKAKAPKES